ncbi:hypothetical protein FACS1894127_4700 [Clostridia bacterium]|nr:hypothetical protein FACS1894127_4700 [Clostridia bacterium]
MRCWDRPWNPDRDFGDIAECWENDMCGHVESPMDETRQNVGKVTGKWTREEC